MTAPTVLPHDEEAEAGLVGALLADGGEGATSAAALVRPDDFYASRLGAVFGVIIDRAERGEPIDVLSVAVDLERSGVSADRMKLRDLAAAAPFGAASVRGYADRVKRLAAQRRTASAMKDALDRSLADAEDPAKIVAALDAELSVAVRGAIAEATPVGPLIDEALSALEARSGGGRRPEIASGFRDLDSLIIGLGPGELIVLAARPGVGKSALAMNVARNVAAHSPVLFFSLEMGRYELTLRMLCAEAGVSLARVRGDKATPDDWRGLLAAVEHLAPLPLYFVDRATVVLSELRAIARTIPGLGLIVVDYMQLVPSASPRSNRQEQVAEISRGLKLLARELELPVIGVSQLNRDPERRQDKRPQLSDLRESGSIEQDADVVMMLHRNAAKPGVAEIIIAKQRNGPTESVRLSEQLHLSRFRDYSGLYAEGPL